MSTYITQQIEVNRNGKWEPIEFYQKYDTIKKEGYYMDEDDPDKKEYTSSDGEKVIMGKVSKLSFSASCISNILDNEDLKDRGFPKDSSLNEQELKKDYRYGFSYFILSELTAIRDKYYTETFSNILKYASIPFQKQTSNKLDEILNLLKKTDSNDIDEECDENLDDDSDDEYNDINQKYLQEELTESIELIDWQIAKISSILDLANCYAGDSDIRVLFYFS